MQMVIALIVLIVIISAVVGIVAQFLNKLSDPKPAARRAVNTRPEGRATVRQADREMDRFLAEIDRLRKKKTDQPSAQSTPAPIVVTPVARVVRRPERPRSRQVAELVQAVPIRRVDPQPESRPEPSQKQASFPEPMVVTAPVVPGSVAAGETRVTKFAGRPLPAAKTDFAKNLTALLNNRQGLATALVLQEIFGPPRCKRR